jgi:hypothetical protein
MYEFYGINNDKTTKFVPACTLKYLNGCGVYYNYVYAGCLDLHHVYMKSGPADERCSYASAWLLYRLHHIDVECHPTRYSSCPLFPPHSLAEPIADSLNAVLLMLAPLEIQPTSLSIDVGNICPP